MSLFGNFKSNRFNEGNPFFQRKLAKKRAQEEAMVEQKRLEEIKKNKKEIKDITNDTEQ